MSTALNVLIERARHVQMTAEEREEQRRSFAYGNTKIENPQITRQLIDQEADKLASENGKEHC